MKICLVCSYGGHLTEILKLMDAFEGHETFFITCKVPRTQNLKKRKYYIPILGKNPIKFIYSMPFIIRILNKEKPNLIVSTGAGIAIPVFYIAKLFNIKTLYIESWSRVNNPSITGKVVYPITNIFLVQWKQLLNEYGNKASYWGGIV